MKLSGSYQINLEKQKVWEALNDPEILQKTIPGCEEFKKNSDTEFFATGEAFVALEDCDGGTKLTYTVEANVGGKIAQVGSRLIDMTAKKMADIFFGKFSELVSIKSNALKTETVSEVKVSREKKSINKILIYSSLIIIIAIFIYSIS